MTHHIHPIPALKDNYIWLLANPDNHKALIVDPGDAQPVIDYLESHQLDLAAMLITHHHWDHTNGIEALKAKYGCLVYGSIDNQHTAITDRFNHGDSLKLPALGLEFQAIAVPGHTLDHMAFYLEPKTTLSQLGQIVEPKLGHPQGVPLQVASSGFKKANISYSNEEAPYVFTGDTLFSAGCGRIFEGTPSQMYESLQRLLALPDDTRIFCGHEYTLSNLKFAKQVEPNNPVITEHQGRVESLRAKGLASLPSTIALEKQINPFLRATEPDVIQAASQYAGKTLAEPWQVFAALREWKNAL
jgi:hydroxyacylglutathione hydrolase